MNSNETARDLFGTETLSTDIVDEFKTKLAWTTTHVGKTAADKAAVVGSYNDTLKHLKKMQAALAEAIRFKTIQPLYDEFGDEWGTAVESIQPLYVKERP
jgi:hypothetical protein